MLLVTNFVITKLSKKHEKMTETLGTDLRVLSESYPMNTNITGFRWFSESVVSLCLEGEMNYNTHQSL